MDRKIIAFYEANKMPYDRGGNHATGRVVVFDDGQESYEFEGQEFNVAGAEDWGWEEDWR